MAGNLKLLGGQELLRSFAINLYKNGLKNIYINKITCPTYICKVKANFFSYNRNVPVIFRQLTPKEIFPKLLITLQNKFKDGFPKTFFQGIDQDPRKKRVPKLLLKQNPFKWVMVKIDFFVLRHTWDRTFEEKEFKFGTKQAISLVTRLISSGQLTELNGLLTKAARDSLLRELDRNWSDSRHRALLALTRDDIQITSPRRVHFITIAGKKYCDVDMAFVAVKWVPINAKDTLILTEIFARFHRDYTPHCIPEWTIAFFKVIKLEILKR